MQTSSSAILSSKQTVFPYTVFTPIVLLGQDRLSAAHFQVCGLVICVLPPLWAADLTELVARGNHLSQRSPFVFSMETGYFDNVRDYKRRGGSAEWLANVLWRMWVFSKEQNEKRSRNANRNTVCSWDVRFYHSIFVRNEQFLPYNFSSTLHYTFITI